MEQFSKRFLIPNSFLQKSPGKKEEFINGHVLKVLPASIPATVTPVRMLRIDVCSMAVASILIALILLSLNSSEVSKIYY